MMFRTLSVIAFSAFLSLAPVAATEGDTPDFIGKYESSSEDIAAIQEALNEFGRAIRDKDGEAIKKLYLYDDIFFHPAVNSEQLKWARENRYPDYFQKHPSGEAQSFVKYVTESKKQLEERFYNVKITQDADFALVVFDYDFRENGRVTNYGIETWQMFKVDGSWRLVTVTWTSKPPNS